MAFADKTIHIVGAGLAGSECAFQLAERGHKVVLYEMRGETLTPAHKTSDFAELVCSNSFGSITDYSAPGQLKWEAEELGSLNLKCAKAAAVPAGMALGVDRDVFSKMVTKTLEEHPNVTISRKVITDLDTLPRPAVIATGPLTHPELAQSMREHLAESDDDTDFLYFFDAIAPIIDAESIDYDIVWRGDRYGKGTGDYLNCPLTKEQYENLIAEINGARKIEPKDFEATPFFEGCMPIEEVVRRGPDTARYGCMSPKGLRDPRTDQNFYAVVQLRQDNKEGTAYNMVGFQTKMAYPEQKRVFRMIPGLEEAEFFKLGSMHRNLYIHSPKKLSPVLASKKDSELYFAGQITGVEGYFESTCIGLLIALFLHSQLKGEPFNKPPRESALGALLNAITEEKEDFQPTNINFGLLPPLPDELKPKGKGRKRARRDMQLVRAKQALLNWLGRPIEVVQNNSQCTEIELSP